jgi:hypothetical protein
MHSLFIRRASSALQNAKRNDSINHGTHQEVKLVPLQPTRGFGPLSASPKIRKHFRVLVATTARMMEN